jgi:hypothetical protein
MLVLVEDSCDDAGDGRFLWRCGDDERSCVKMLVTLGDGGIFW